MPDLDGSKTWTNDMSDVSAVDPWTMTPQEAGQAIAAMIAVVWPATAHNPAVLWSSFLGFWLLNMFVVWCGVVSIRFLQSF